MNNIKISSIFVYILTTSLLSIFIIGNYTYTYVNATTHADGIDQKLGNSNICLTESKCQNEGYNSIISELANDIKSKINQNIDQTLEQINSCIDSTCLNEGNNKVHLKTLGELRADIDQTLEQINVCKNATCKNEGNNVIVGSGETTTTSLISANQQVFQRNECSDGAKCVNEGSNIIITGK